MVRGSHDSRQGQELHEHAQGCLHHLVRGPCCLLGRSPAPAAQVRALHGWPVGVQQAFWRLLSKATS